MAGNNGYGGPIGYAHSAADNMLGPGWNTGGDGGGGTHPLIGTRNTGGQDSVQNQYVGPGRQRWAAGRDRPWDWWRGTPQGQATTQAMNDYVQPPQQQQQQQQQLQQQQQQLQQQQQQQQQPGADIRGMAQDQYGRMMQGSQQQQQPGADIRGMAQDQYGRMMQGSQQQQQYGRMMQGSQPLQLDLQSAMIERMRALQNRLGGGN